MDAMEATALYDNPYLEPGDLAFQKGQKIRITENLGEWLRGEYNDDGGVLKQGIFPTNYVKIMTKALASPPPPPPNKPKPLPPIPPPPPPPPKTTNPPPPPPPKTNNPPPPPPPPKATNPPPAKLPISPLAPNAAIPLMKPSKLQEKVLALYNFDAVEKSDMSFKKGEIILVIEKIDQDWYVGQIGSRTGVFPKSYTKPISNEQEYEQEPITKEYPRNFEMKPQPPPKEFFVPSDDVYSVQMELISSSSKGTKKIEKFEIHKMNRDLIRLCISQGMNDPNAHIDSFEKVEFKPLNEHELMKSGERYGPLIVKFCQDRLGKHVGNGECWTLANEAVIASGAEKPIGTNFGQEIDWRSCRPGDILQFRECQFKYPNGSTAVAGMPDHTAIVAGIHGSEISVYEQNPKPTSPGSYKMSCLTSGEFKCYRVIPPQ